MTALVWGSQESKKFEFGLDRGVLYPPDGPAVAWNGLASVEEKPQGGKVQSYFVDGDLYLNLATSQYYQATLSAFTYPDEFEAFDGTLNVVGGISITHQPRRYFGLSYRTKVGKEGDVDFGYKIHLIYNAVAIQKPRNFESTAQLGSPMLFKWDITAVPPPIEGFKPSAHIVIDTTKIQDPLILEAIENILYGDETKDAALPLPNELIAFGEVWPNIVITDNGDGTWTATGPSEVIYMTSDTEFTIEQVDTTVVDSDTIQIHSTPA